ncbi:hypothetical protein COW46_00045 [Candidatus Gracilibacteria bacterium CG17_big_fil_post_rev_8_21_14_2_50_48_13]|nr:MAG: hypothetical protein COW46_00045 [Candidatus Gracilibacteria bacterium CG17_big_fil_post_rev_8_21_14_2_50_48_13]
MRGRIVFLTFLIAASFTALYAQAKDTTPAQRSVSTQSVVLSPATGDVSSLYTRSTLRNIFAPLSTFVSKRTSSISVQPAQTESLPQSDSVPQGTTRLAAMVDHVTFQDTTEQFSETEKTRIDTLLAQAFAKFPAPFVDQLSTLTLKKSRTGSRGLAGANVMILRTAGVTDPELVAVAIHELGHVVDMGVFQGNMERGASTFMDGKTPVYLGDTSLAFYRLSWSTDTTKLRDAVPQDFVSGYAQQDPFEDFAETFAMYVLHGERFRAIAEDNTVLRAKYAHLRDMVFEGREFSGIDGIDANTDTTFRPWDVTREPYNTEVFRLASFR